MGKSTHRINENDHNFGMQSPIDFKLKPSSSFS